jgi:hypothetical protein
LTPLRGRAGFEALPDLGAALVTHPPAKPGALKVVNRSKRYFQKIL